MTTQDIRKEIVTAVESVVRQEMGAFGLESVRVRSGEDHDGDPALIVDVEYSPRGRPIEPKIVAGLVTKLRDRLWGLGETRFPYLYHHFSEQQKIAGIRGG